MAFFDVINCLILRNQQYQVIDRRGSEGFRPECGGVGCLLGEDAPLVDDKHEGAKGCSNITQWKCKPHTVKLHGGGKPEHQRYEEDDLTSQGEEDTFARFADALEKCGGYDLEADEPKCPEA